MQNFQDSFETFIEAMKQSFIIALSICMTATLITVRL